MSDFRDRLHYHNLRHVTGDDILVVSYGASGQTLLANILLELGLHYVNPATEIIHPDGTTTPDPTALAYRGRTHAMHLRDAQGGAAARPGPRFMKSHLFPEEFSNRAFGGVWLLVRDPRDTVYSYYRFRQEFPDVPWERITGTIGDFLGTLDYTGRQPADDWHTFYRRWTAVAERSPRRAVIRFEDLKTDPVPALAASLHAFGVDLPAADLAAAVEASTFARMRAHEDTVAGQDAGKEQSRVMRRGVVGEWREWMTPDLAVHFTGAELRETARLFGYSMQAGG